MSSKEKIVDIYRYFHLNREKDIFSNLTQLEYDSTDKYLTYIKDRNLAVISYNEHYLQHRINTEKSLYDQFVQKGGKPRIRTPYYFTLGKCNDWFYNQKNCFGCIGFSVEEFDPAVISFTYGDSVPSFMPEFQDGKEYRSQVYTLDEIFKVIEKYGMPNIWNTFEQNGPENYIEVQIWTDEYVSDLTCKLTKFKDISSNELAIRMIKASDNIKQELSTQKSLDYCIQKCKAHEKWTWFCELVKKVPPTVFCSDYVHGVSHAHKCALTAFFIANELDLNTVDFNTLVYAALFHDIGRRYYNDRRRHGIVSSEKIISFIDEKDVVHMEQLKEAVSKHDDYELTVDDDNSFLIWLRDIDSLDYLRLGMGQYTTKYLKTNIAKTLVKCSIELNIMMYLDNHQYIYKLVREVKI